MKTSKPVLNANLGEFIKEIIVLAGQGWEIDDNNPPSLFGYMYETVMLRDENIEDPPAPLTRAEIAAKAREAKAAKKAAKEETEKEDTGGTNDESDSEPESQSA